ncbi:MAG: hypothetical protein LBP26_04815 [Clostridiales bacterium]|jgi:hypothetical protein|nr:hypothetical protein [Clostridiales bacterium]
MADTELEKDTVKFVNAAVIHANSEFLDWKTSNKQEKILSTIAAKYCMSEQEDTFYKGLFEHTNPTVRKCAAFYSDTMNYDLYRSLEIFVALAKEQNVVFSTNAERNNDIIQGIVCSIDRLKDKIKNYEKFGDGRLYRQYYNFYRMAYEYINYLIERKEEKMNDYLLEIIDFAEQIVRDGKGDKFFETAFNEKENVIKIVISLVSVKLNYDIDKSVKTLQKLVAGGKKSLNPRMLQFTKELLAEIKNECG